MGGQRHKGVVRAEGGLAAPPPPCGTGPAGGAGLARPGPAGHRWAWRAASQWAGPGDKLCAHSPALAIDLRVCL